MNGALLSLIIVMNAGNVVSPKSGFLIDVSKKTGSSLGLINVEIGDLDVEPIVKSWKKLPLVSIKKGSRSCENKLGFHGNSLPVSRNVNLLPNFAAARLIIDDGRGYCPVGNADGSGLANHKFTVSEIVWVDLQNLIVSGVKAIRGDNVQ